MAKIYPQVHVTVTVKPWPTVSLLPPSLSHCQYHNVPIGKGTAITLQALDRLQRVPGGWGSQISRQSTHEGGKVVSPTHRPPLTAQEIFPVLIFVRGWVDPRATVRPEGLGQWKIPMTPSGIEAATFWLVAQCLNWLRHRVPHIYIYIYTECLQMNGAVSKVNKKFISHLTRAQRTASAISVPSSRVQQSKKKKKNKKTLTLEEGSKFCPETSVRYWHSTLRKIPKYSR